MEVGILYLVATPIGNLDDISLRAIKTLQDVDIIAAEDTRQTIKLLNHLNIKKPMISYHEHNKYDKGKYIIQKIKSGNNVALVSDAGTPAISDPGEELVQFAIKDGIKVTPIPGAVAGINGLIASGLKTGRFIFEGFLPMNKRARKERILFIKDDPRTIIFYEAPHKLIYTLKDFYEILGGDRNIVLARELTKKFENFFRGTIKEALEKYEIDKPRGEFVIILEGVDIEKIETTNFWDNLTIEEHFNYYIKKDYDKKDAIKQIAKDRKMKKRDVYNYLVEMKDDTNI